MSKILLLRISNGTIRALYSDGMEIKDLENIREWCLDRISDKKAMGKQQ